MSINLKLYKDADRILFCSSKWWGNPDMPEAMQYPTVRVEEDGESYDYPLTFLCQINCEDIARYDAEGLLPHEGMLYFFAAIDECLGYDAPYRTLIGEWEKGKVVVKYAKEINFETFQTVLLEGEGGEDLADSELVVEFSTGSDGNISLLADDADDEFVTLLRISGNEILKVPEAEFSIRIRKSDLHYGNWKRALGQLSISN
ncbi:MAG: DUF1963 domain-containing protein [Candidatus Cryptobacteroides sp.]